MLRIFKEDSKPECEAALWSKLNHAADVLLTNIDNLPVAQGKVPDKEKEYNAAKATYETAQKSRLDSIKEELKNNA